MLKQLLEIKRCRETGLRNRMRRIEAEIAALDDEARAKNEEQRAARTAWLRASEEEHAVGAQNLYRVRRRMSELYEQDQEVSARLDALEAEVGERRNDAAKTDEVLRSNMKGQEKLRAVMEKAT